MKMKQILFAVCIFLFVASCHEGPVFDEVQNIPGRAWDADKPVSFVVQVNDTTMAYDLMVLLRNTNQYSYSNFWLFIETTAPSGVSLRDTFEIQLAGPDGHWLGKGLGSMNTLLVPYKVNIRFPYRGIYTFKMIQAMRDEDKLGNRRVKGISDIGLRILPH